VTLGKVIARDKGRCKICGVKVKRYTCKKGESPPDNGATLDHILPLVKGGDHVWSNVQCCCFKCNVQKSDNALGQFSLEV
jgi:5-methylcytosine-specific restriction endonuclease McrA